MFAGEEIRLIKESSDPDAMLWMLWAGKEAAYKALSKSTQVSSSPSRFRVAPGTPAVSDSIGGYFSGRVIAPGAEISLGIFREDDYVHAIASLGTAEIAGKKIIWSVRRITGRRDRITASHQSHAVRKEARDLFARQFHARKEDISIVRRRDNRDRQGPPVLLLNGKKAAIDISLSHDGMFIACALLCSTK